MNGCRRLCAKRQGSGDLNQAAEPAIDNMPAPLEARALPYAGTMRIATWVFATIVGFALFYFGLVMGSFVPWLALPLTIGGIAAALWCAWMLRAVWLEVKANAPVITVNAQGYRDTRLGETIPWREVKAIRREQPGTQVMLKVEAVRAERFLKPRRRIPFGTKPARPVPPGVAVTSFLSGLDRRGDDIVAAVERFFPVSRS